MLDELDSVFFDRCLAARLSDCDMVLGAASSSLYSGKAVQRRGGTYVLDRACPDIRGQQDVLAEEARKAGGVFHANSSWFIDRQVEEYEQADFILSPSRYSIQSFPDAIQNKVVLAPLAGRAKVSVQAPRPVSSEFVMGVVGNDALRKGYLYLLQAWKELNLPNAQLKIRSGADFRNYRVLSMLLSEQSNISIVGYIQEISTFYGQCDAFILPSVDDGFGMALFEALAHGVPSIATANCGASELLVNGRDCLVIKACSVPQIKEAILRLYESRELRERLQVNGPAALRSLQPDHMVGPYEHGINLLMKRIASSKTQNFLL